MKGKGRESRVTQMLTKKRIIALATLLVMLIQTFSPYSVLINTSYAAVDPDTDTLIAVTASEVEDSSSGNKIIKVTYAVTGENIASLDFSIGYDSTKIKPARKGTGAECTVTTISNANTSCAEWGDLADIFDVDTRRLTADSCNIRLSLSHPEGEYINLADEGYYYTK